MSTLQPALPEPAHGDVDSMLTRKFGREVANYFSGSPLNRLSFLRADHKFLSAALHHPSTRLLLLNQLAPLAHSPSSLAFVSRSDVVDVLGEGDPFSTSEDELIAAFDSSQTAPQLIFLGLDEGYDSGGDEASLKAVRTAQQSQLDNQPDASTQARPAPFEWTHNSRYAGRPYFALDVSPKGGFRAAAEGLVARYGASHRWLEGRTHMNLPAAQAAVYAAARSLADWNARNPFCAGCGQPSLSVNAGFKRMCPPTDAAGLAGGAQAGTAPAPAAKARPECATRGVVSNITFPRTDPTIIVAVLSADSRRILLGRQRRWPPHWYSTLAGFIEPAESVEEAVRREVWEESGIRLGRVQVHSTQPWPYPANLMIGAAAQALPDGETVRLDNDPELEDAHWFTIEEVREALRVGTGGLDDMSKTGEGYKEGGLRLPPPTAIANQLITALVEGYAGGVGKL